METSRKSVLVYLIQYPILIQHPALPGVADNVGRRALTAETADRPDVLRERSLRKKGGFSAFAARAAVKFRVYPRF